MLEAIIESHNLHEIDTEPTQIGTVQAGDMIELHFKVFLIIYRLGELIKSGRSITIKIGEGK